MRERGSLSCPTGRVVASSVAELAGKRLAESAVLFPKGIQFCMQGRLEFFERSL